MIWEEIGWTDPERRDQALERLAARINDYDRTKVSPLEARALQGAAVGLSMEMIAEVYGVAYDTIHTQIESAKKKLGAKNLTHAVTLAMRQGLIH